MAKITSKQTFEMGISVGKNLLQVEYWSQYGEHGKVTKQENRVYLKNGQQFQIFLKNFRGVPVMVEITINGETQEKTIILDPQERLFLERYLSSNNKFKFNTYELSVGLKKLIESKVELGVVTARVYAVESVYSDRDVKLTNIPQVQHVVDFNNQPIYGSGGTGDFVGYNAINLNTLVTSANTHFPGNISGSCATYGVQTNTKLASKSKGAESINYSFAPYLNDIQANQAERIIQETNARAEIGAIEKGGWSEQKFEASPDFRKGRLLDTYTIHVYPVSAQLQEETKSSQKIEGAIYCSVCGRKQKSGQKFCPADGTEFGK